MGYLHVASVSCFSAQKHYVELIADAHLEPNSFVNDDAQITSSQLRTACITAASPMA
jgi:hypothetical protein